MLTGMARTGECCYHPDHEPHGQTRIVGLSGLSNRRHGTCHNHDFRRCLARPACEDKASDCLQRKKFEPIHYDPVGSAVGSPSAAPCSDRNHPPTRRASTEPDPPPSSRWTSLLPDTSRPDTPRSRRGSQPRRFPPGSQPPAQLFQLFPRIMQQPKLANGSFSRVPNNQSLRPIKFAYPPQALKVYGVRSPIPKLEISPF